jgi:hypothetical protein
MSVLVDHSAETIVSAYGEAFDPVGFELPPPSAG